MTRVKGSIDIDGSVAYVAQTAWIINATLRDNILLGLPFDEERYNAVLDACDLSQDLAILPAGDFTEIGEKVCVVGFTGVTCSVLCGHTICFLAPA